MLLKIDLRDYEISLAQARADLAAARCQVNQAQAEVSAIQAKVAQTQASVIAAEAPNCAAADDLKVPGMWIALRFPKARLTRHNRRRARPELTWKRRAVRSKLRKRT